MIKQSAFYLPCIMLTGMSVLGSLVADRMGLMLADSLEVMQMGELPLISQLVFGLLADRMLIPVIIGIGSLLSAILYCIGRNEERIHFYLLASNVAWAFLVFMILGILMAYSLPFIFIGFRVG